MSKVIILLLYMMEILQKSLKKINFFRSVQYCKIKEKAMAWHPKAEALTVQKARAFSFILHTRIEAAK